MSKSKEAPIVGLTVSKADNLSAWYLQIIKKGQFLEYTDVSGFYIFLPNVYFMWEQAKAFLNSKFASNGVLNAYFPLLIPKKNLQIEKEHLEGFEPEVAWIHKTGKKELTEPLAIRPTSETIFYPYYASSLRSYADLPIKWNQWSNVIRWEFKQAMPLIRSHEFLWQEGHCVYATEEESVAEARRYREFYEQAYRECLSVFVLRGDKTRAETFPGAVKTFTLESFIPAAGKAIQAATAHHLGTNFSKMFGIRFLNEKNESTLAHQNCWGFTTRSLGVMLLQHGDDKGAVLPPAVARVQAVIVPVLFKNKKEVEILQKAHEVLGELKRRGVRVHLDDRPRVSPGAKYNHWKLRGVPVRVEIGPRDLEINECVVVRRDTFEKEKSTLDYDELHRKLLRTFEAVKSNLYEKSKQNTLESIQQGKTWQEFMGIVDAKKMALMPSCCEEKCEEGIVEKSGDKEAVKGAAKSLCIPEDFQEKFEDGSECFHCGEKAKRMVLYGRSY